MENKVKNSMFLEKTFWTLSKERVRIHLYIILKVHSYGYHDI